MTSIRLCLSMYKVFLKEFPTLPCFIIILHQSLIPWSEFIAFSSCQLWHFCITLSHWKFYHNCLCARLSPQQHCGLLKIGTLSCHLSVPHLSEQCPNTWELLDNFNSTVSYSRTIRETRDFNILYAIYINISGIDYYNCVRFEEISINHHI